MKRAKSKKYMFLLGDWCAVEMTRLYMLRDLRAAVRNHLGLVNEWIELDGEIGDAACLSSNVIMERDGRSRRFEAIFVMKGDIAAFRHEVGHAAFDVMRHLRTERKLRAPAGLGSEQRRLWWEEKHLEMYELIFAQLEVEFSA